MEHSTVNQQKACYLIGPIRRWSSAVPLASAALVTAVGVGITLSGLATYLG